MADNTMLTVFYIGTDLGYIADSGIKSPQPMFFVVKDIWFVTYI